MSDALIEELLAAREQHRAIAPPSEKRRLSLAEAYTVQDRLREALVARGDRVIGWKAGFTNKAAQTAYGCEEPVCGFLLAAGVFPNHAEVPSARFASLVVEAEVAFVLKHDLVGPGVTPVRALLAVEGAVPALELVDFRMSGKPVASDVVADGVFANAIVVGAPLTDVAHLDLAVEGLVYELNGAVVATNAAAGAGVVVADLAETADATAAEIRRSGGRAVAVRGDVSRSADMRVLAERSLREFGGLDVLVTCAGLGLSGLLLDQDEEEWTRVIDVNLNGTYRAIRAALPQMMAQGGGRIITIASILGKMGGYGFVSAYAASKHGVVGLTRALAAELGAQGFPGITVNAICPGYVRAGMGIAMQSTKAGPVSGTEIFERYYKRLVPQRRMIEAEEIAHAAVFLALPESAGVTGQALNVDGGFFMS